jgi:hypothetical protein
MFLQTESSPAWRDCIEATNQAQKVSMRKHRPLVIETHEHAGEFNEP